MGSILNFEVNEKVYDWGDGSSNIFIPVNIQGAPIKISIHDMMPIPYINSQCIIKKGNEGDETGTNTSNLEFIYVNANVWNTDFIIRNNDTASTI